MRSFKKKRKVICISPSSSHPSLFPPDYCYFTSRCQIPVWKPEQTQRVGCLCTLHALTHFKTGELSWTVLLDFADKRAHLHRVLVLVVQPVRLEQINEKYRENWLLTVRGRLLARHEWTYTELRHVNTEEKVWGACTVSPTKQWLIWTFYSADIAASVPYTLELISRRLWMKPSQFSCFRISLLSVETLFALQLCGLWEEEKKTQTETVTSMCRMLFSAISKIKKRKSQLKSPTGSLLEVNSAWCANTEKTD